MEKSSLWDVRERVNPIHYKNIKHIGHVNITLTQCLLTISPHITVLLILLSTIFSCFIFINCNTTKQRLFFMFPQKAHFNLKTFYFNYLNQLLRRNCNHFHRKNNFCWNQIKKTLSDERYSSLSIFDIFNIQYFYV